MNTDLYLTDYNSRSQKWLVFEDDGITGWAYLTNKTMDQILVDCWVYNQIKAPDQSETHRDRPPPAPKQCLIDCAAKGRLTEKDFSFRWDEQGDSVYILINNQVTALIDGTLLRSYNANLSTECAWGLPLKF